MYDIMLAIYNGKSLSGSLLQFVNAESAQMNFNQLGGLGQASYTIQAEMSSAVMADCVAPNRVDCFVRRGILTTSVLSGNVSINVSHPQNLAIGDKMAIWDGTHYDFVVVEAISGSSIGFTPALAHGYSAGATILTLKHRGMIQAVDSDSQLANLQKITVISYFQELNNLSLGSGNFNAYECGYVLFNVLLNYTAVLDLVITSSNFIMSSDGTTDSGTHQEFTANYQGGVQFSTFITDLINAANGNSANVASSTPTAYSLWIDVNNILYFKAVNEYAPTITYTVNSYEPDPFNIGLYDVVADYTEHTQDTSVLCNSYYLMGGNYSSSQTTPVSVVVQDATSIGIYGEFDQVVTLSNITDVNTLTAAGQGMLNNTAYPIDSYNIIVTPCETLAFPNVDCVEVAGFTDSSTRIMAIQSTMIEWSATQFGQFKQTIKGGQLRPSIVNVLNKISSQTALATQAVTQGQYSNLQDRIIISGIDASYTTNQFTTTAGVFQANVGIAQSSENYYTDVDTVAPINSGTQLQLTLNITGSAYVYLTDANGNAKNVTVSGSYSGTDSGGARAYTGSTTFTYYNSSETFVGTYTWRVQEATLASTWTGTNAWHSTIGSSSAPYNITINNTVTELNEFPVGANTFTIPSNGSYTVAYLYRNTDGTIFATPELILFQGFVTSSYTQYQYCPLYVVTCLASGVISGFKAIHVKSGITNNHLAGNPAPSTPPQFAVLPSAFTYIGSGSGSYGAETAFTLTNGQLPWLSELRYYAVVHGAGSSASRSAVGDLAPTANGQYSVIWSGLSGGQQYDLYITFVDNQSNECTPLFVGTTSSNALQLSRANQASFPSGGYTPVASSVAYTGEYNYGTTQDVELTFTLDSLGYTSSPWLAGFMLLTAPYGSGAFSGNAMIPPIASGTYTVLFNNIAIGQEIQLAIQPIDYAGNFGGSTYLYTVGSTNILHSANSDTVLGVLGNDGTITGTGTGQNLVYNGNLAIYTPPTGIQGQYASAVRVNDVNYQGTQRETPNGWTRSFEYGYAGDGTIGYVDDPTYGRYMEMFDATSAGNCAYAAVCDAFPVVGAQSYSFFADVYFGSIIVVPQAQWYFAVFWYANPITDFTRSSSSIIHVDYIVAGSTTNPGFATTQGTLTAPTGSVFCRIALYHWLSAPSSAVYTVAFRNVRCYEVGNHSIMSPATQAVISAGGGLSVNPAGGVTGTLPYGNNSGAITSAVNSSGQIIGTITNIGNVSGGNLPYANASVSEQVALNSVGTITGPGGTRFTTISTGSYSGSTTGTVSASLSIPTVGSWFVSATWVVQVSNTSCSVGITSSSGTASTGFAVGSFIYPATAMVTGSTGGGTITATFTYSGSSMTIYPGLITFAAFRYA